MQITIAQTKKRICPLCKGKGVVKTTIYCDIFTDPTYISGIYERQLLHIECPTCNGNKEITMLMSEFFTESDFEKFVNKSWDDVFVPLKEKYKTRYGWSIVPTNKPYLTLKEVDVLTKNTKSSNN